MHKTKLITCLLGAVTLLVSQGCCDADAYYSCYPQAQYYPQARYYPQATGITYDPNCPPVVNCPPPPPPPPAPVVDCAPVVSYPPAVDCPPPKPIRQKKARKTRYTRKKADCYIPYGCYPGTATLVPHPGYAPAVYYSSVQPVAPAVNRSSEVAGRSVTILQRGRRGRKVWDDSQPRRRTTTTRPVAAVTPVTPVYAVTPGAFVSGAPVVDPCAITPLTAPQPAAVTEEPAPSKYMEAKPTVTEAKPEPLSEPIAQAVKPKEPEPIPEVKPEPVVEVVPEPVAEPKRELAALPLAPAPAPEPAPEAPKPVIVQPEPVVAMVQAKPVVIQPIIQPIIQPAQPQVLAYEAPPAPIPVPEPAQSYPQQGYPTGYDLAYANPNPVMVSTSYNFCPPWICPAPVNPVVCGPGRNMSDCFTLSESQLLNSPEILTPSASGSLSLAVPPAAPSPLAPPAAAVAAPAVPPVVTPPAQAPTAAATAAPVPEDKYVPLAPPAETPREIARPEVNMPAPLNTRDNIPPVPGTGEIESALDAMLSGDAPVLK